MKKLTLLVLIVLISAGTALAWKAPDFHRIYPYLKDIPNWKAEKPVGQSMTLNGSSFSMAMRTYSKGNKSATVIVGFGLFGPAASYISQLGGLPTNFSQETDEVIIKTTTYKGFRAFVQIHKKEKSGFIGVVLLPSSNPSQIGYLALNFENMTLSEAESFLNNFDLNGIRSLIK